MSTPPNPLDVYTTYTYHFELHADASWDQLAKVNDTVSELSTTRLDSNGTLLINTRKDAHQVIQALRYQYTMNTTDPSGLMAPGGLIMLQIDEPTGVFFVQKLLKHAAKYKIEQIASSLYFAIKVIFVGRRSDNTVDIIPAKKLIACLMSDMSAEVTNLGSTYVMTLCPYLPPSDDSGSSQAPALTQFDNVHKSISITSHDIGSAMQELQQKLNQNYKDYYATISDPSAKPRYLEYEINLDPGIAGTISSTTRVQYKDNTTSTLTLPADSMGIAQMIREILNHSPELNNEIAAGKENVKVEYQPGVTFYTINPRIYSTDTTTKIAYDIIKYSGGKPPASNMIEFDYFFADPGKNVDVMAFDIKLNSMIAFIENSNSAVDKNVNHSGEMPTYDPAFYSANIVTPDHSSTIQEVNRTPQQTPLAPGDIRVIPSRPSSEQKGRNTHPVSSTAAARLAFQSAVDATSAGVETQFSFTIRGNLDLFNSIGYMPDQLVDKDATAGVGSALWCKVHINQLDEFGNRVPFFYTGAYQINTIDNIFEGGKFTQILTVMTTLNDDSQNDNADQSTTPNP